MVITILGCVYFKIVFQIDEYYKIILVMYTYIFFRVDLLYGC
jgi:hypothetical protein